jgi:hypothetical protein
MDRRTFIGIAGLGAAQGFGLPAIAKALGKDSARAASQEPAYGPKSYGSGHFGEWIADEFGLPAYKYTCNQLTDPKAVSPTHKEWRSATDQTHMVGNSRLVTAVSNYGYVQVRQDEGSPKFLNDYFPEGGHYGGGIGFLTDGKSVLSTYYPGNADSFDRVLGEGYYKKTVKGHQYEVEHTILAPYGDDPVVVSMVKITNHGAQAADLRWVEYWCALNMQFSYRCGMEADALNDTSKAAALRRSLGGRFAHKFEALPNGAGLMETQTFLGRLPEDEASWKKIEASMDDPNGPWGGHKHEPSPASSFEDLAPPPTFLASLDAPADGYATDSAAFFGAGGIEHPSGLAAKLANDLTSTGPASAHLLERRVSLKPGESRTICFLYGYVPDGFKAESLIRKYSVDPAGILARSNAKWKHEGLRFEVPSEPWVGREISWHNYYLRSSMTYDSYFREHIISQGHVYQYIMGFQGAARDPLQHTMPFIFSDPAVVRGIIRYTLKEIQPDGSIPYGLVGSGVPMASEMDPGDQEMWLLWTTSEYVLATRDTKFLDEKIIPYPRRESSPTDPTVREYLARAYTHLVNVIGVGKHGLMRLARGDWNDGIVLGRVPKELMEEVRQDGESVLNAAMACYVLDYYARMLAFIGDKETAAAAHAKADAQRKAVQAVWVGRWFERAYLGAHLDWSGGDRMWLEPQPWAIIGGATTPEQNKTLVASIDELLRHPSPIGAMILDKGENLPGKQPGILENGGVWPSINGTLIWALAMIDPRIAWDEWKKNCLSAHAEAYPNIWYGIWSGPDTYNSVQSKWPGETQQGDPAAKDSKTATDPGIYWTDFPVMNMHPHGWPLYSAVKLLGTDFRTDGVGFKPAIPAAEFVFESPLLAFKKSAKGYSGWYAPSVGGHWTIEIELTAAEAAGLKQLKVNGTATPLDGKQTTIKFAGESSPGKPLQWELS